MTEPLQSVGHCRLATPADRPHFVRLWRDHLTEMHKLGSAILPNERNLYTFWDYFEAYTTGRLDGVVVLWEPAPGEEPAGVVMAGTDYHDSLFDLDRGGERWAKLWGVYVDLEHRGQRLGLAMELVGMAELRRRGFHRVITSVRVENEMGHGNWRHWDETCGVQPIEEVIVADLWLRKGE